MRRCAVVAAVAALVLGAGPAAGQGSLDCQRCHGEPELLRQYVETLREAQSLTVRSEVMAESGHQGMTCAECHTGYGRFPHVGATSTETCASCHEEVESDWRTGLHAGTAETEAVACGECHGIHDVASVAALDEGPAMSAMSGTCVSCHETQRLPVDAHHEGHAGCYECHNPHGVHTPDDPESWMAPLNQPQVCGACHDSVATHYTDGVHARALRTGEWEDADDEPPTCTSCHQAHPIRGADDPGATAALASCSGCHEKAARTYHGTYHGKAVELGSEVAATCADCHGAHGIEPADQPSSRVADANLVATCGECHEHARPGFVLYDSHPEPMNRERNPVLFYAFWFMNSLLIGTLGVFGLHTALWWVRATIDKRRGVSHHGHHGTQEGGGGE